MPAWPAVAPPSRSAGTGSLGSSYADERVGHLRPTPRRATYRRHRQGSGPWPGRSAQRQRRRRQTDADGDSASAGSRSSCSPSPTRRRPGHADRTPPAGRVQVFTRCEPALRAMTMVRWNDRGCRVRRVRCAAAAVWSRTLADRGAGTRAAAPPAGDDHRRVRRCARCRPISSGCRSKRARCRISRRLASPLTA